MLPLFAVNVMVFRSPIMATETTSAGDRKRSLVDVPHVGAPHASRCRPYRGCRVLQFRGPIEWHCTKVKVECPLPPSFASLGKTRLLMELKNKNAK